MYISASQLRAIACKADDWFDEQFQSCHAIPRIFQQDITVRYGKPLVQAKGVLLLLNLFSLFFASARLQYLFTVFFCFRINLIM